MRRTAGRDVFAALRALKLDRSGVTSIEYALIAGLISLAIIAGATALGANLTTTFTNIQTTTASFG
jgi:pilus assembly protein Flp/PilA